VIIQDRGELPDGMRDIPDRWRETGHVPVDQRHWMSLPEYDVARRNVVTDDRLPCNHRLPLRMPAQAVRQYEISNRLVVAPDQPANCGKRCLRDGFQRCEIVCLARKERQALVALLVDSQETRRTIEPGSFQVYQQRMDSWRCRPHFAAGIRCTTSFPIHTAVLINPASGSTWTCGVG